MRVAWWDARLSGIAPTPATVDGRRVVAPDVTAVDARLRFDVANRQASGTATVTFCIEGPPGYPALDLRQPVTSLHLDETRLPTEAFPHRDLGGGPNAEMRVLDQLLEADGPHRLELGYRIETPEVAAAAPVGWEDGGVRFDLWMSDLHPGRYLEQWIPAPLCHDRFALRVEIELVGTDRPHVVVTNHSVQSPPCRVVYPAHYTSLSPMLVMAPVDQVELRTRTVQISGRTDSLEMVTARHVEVDADLRACEADIAGWLAFLAERYGPWVHSDRFTAFVWGPGRGMEYDGATTASVEALEHEVFHSWFGRGVKPATPSDGWIDEAWTSWATASRRREGPRFAVEELGLDGDPVLLYPPHPWARYTPTESYGLGSRLFSGLAHLLGGPDRMRSAMADWYAAHAGELITTDGLQAHLEAWSELDLQPWFARYVHGQGG